MAPGLPVQAAGHGPPGHRRRTRPTRRWPPTSATCALNHLSPLRRARPAGPTGSCRSSQWAEREGYEIDVVTNADLEDHPELLGDGAPYRLYLSVGHDEYWSGPMRDTVEAFIARGGNAAFFSGNTSFWQVRLEDHDAGGPGRVDGRLQGLLQGRPGATAPTASAELTTIWSDHLVGRPENHMTGVSFTRGGYHRIGKRVTNGAGGYTVHRADHWIFDGTGLGYGDVLGAGATVVGYECDGCDFTYRDGLPVPDRRGRHAADFEILGTAPAAALHPRRPPPRPPAPNEPSELEFIASRVFGTRDPEAWSASATATRCSAPTRRPAAAPSSPRAPPTGRTASPGATRRSSRSPATCSTVSPRPPAERPSAPLPLSRGAAACEPVLMRIASDRRYEFALAPTDLWDLATQVDQYQAWWPWLARLDGARFEVGSEWTCSVRPPLPYAVRFTLTLEEVTAPSLAVAAIGGDILGSARLEVREVPGGSEARLVSDLAPRHGLLQAVARLAMPVARFGHDWVLDRGAHQFGAALDTSVDPDVIG